MKKLIKKLAPIILGAALFSVVTVGVAEAAKVSIPISTEAHMTEAEGVVCLVYTISYRIELDGVLINYQGLHGADCHTGVQVGDQIQIIGYLAKGAFLDTNGAICVIPGACEVITDTLGWIDPIPNGFYHADTHIMLIRNNKHYCFGGGPTDPESADYCGTQDKVRVCWTQGMGISSRTGTEALGFVTEMWEEDYRQGTNSFGTFAARSINNQYIDIDDITDPPVSTGQLIVTVKGNGEELYYGEGQDNKPALAIGHGYGVGEDPDLSSGTSNAQVVRAGQTVILLGSNIQPWPASATRAYFSIGSSPATCCLMGPWMLDYEILKVEWRYFFNGSYITITLIE